MSQLSGNVASEPVQLELPFFYANADRPPFGAYKNDHIGGVLFGRCRKVTDSSHYKWLEYFHYFVADLFRIFVFSKNVDARTRHNNLVNRIVNANVVKYPSCCLKRPI